ncbi:MAG: SAM-dependent methyltransferase [Deltaproteobacteria bacterium]|nr:SAM-dependent methyltransferase [Deltaproteobacteria bacterium]
MSESEPLELLETPTRLSKSKVWDLQRTFFASKGPKAWAEEIVPFGISTNPKVAESYAHLIVAFLRDCANDGVPLDPEEPVYVVDLGSGSGRLAYLLARALGRLQKALPPGLPSTTVVATDFAEANLEWMRAHPAMAPLVETGAIDFAHFDAATPGALELVGSGARLETGAIRNPLVVVANYFFDSIPTDVFRVREGRLYEVLVAVGRKPDDGADPTFLEGYDLHLEEQEVVEAPYADPLLNQILEGYRTELQSTGLWIPVGSIACLRHFAAFSGEPMLLLLGDKAYRTTSEMEDRPIAYLARHGSFSTMVNAHAIEQVARARGGFALHARSADMGFTHSLFLVPGLRDRFPETALAFATSIDDFGPREAYQLLRQLHNQTDLTPAACLQLIRLSGHDPWAYSEFGAPLLPAMEYAPPEITLQVRELLERVAENDYWSGRPSDRFARHLGQGYFALGDRKRALQWYRRSLERQGPTSQTWLDMAVCLEEVDREGAIAAYRNALALDPELEHVKGRLEMLGVGSG